MIDQIRTESVLNQLPMKPPDILKILKMMMNARSDQNRICIELQLPMKPPEILKIPKMMMNDRSDRT